MMTTLCGQAMEGNEDVRCQRVADHEAYGGIRLRAFRVHRAFVPSEGLYEWDATDMQLVARP